MVTRADGLVFYVVGINYRKCDTELRGRFALDDQMIRRALASAKNTGIPEAFILSTCNRTEIYGLATHAEALINVLCAETAGTVAEFSKVAYVQKQAKAAEHLFEVAAGLDSQILGDYEIVGQIKTALKTSKSVSMIGSFLDRLVSLTLQSSKDIKNKTALSGGTVSVSFAAVQAARQCFGDIADKKIVLIGTGKIGSNTCKNLLDYGQAKHITIINRTEEKAQHLAQQFGIAHGSMEDLERVVADADIIITATSSPDPIIVKDHVNGRGRKLIIDLSVPLNVAADVATCENVVLISVDELSRMKDDTLQLRKAEVPKAKEIIAHYLQEFRGWNERRRFAPILSHLKNTLLHLHQHPAYNIHSGSCTEKVNTRIRQVVSETAKRLDVKDTKGCDFISALNQFMN